MASKIPKEAWVPPSIDPTDLDYPLEGPKLGGCFMKIAQVMMFLMAIYGGIAFFNPPKAPPAAAHDAAPTKTATATRTAIPAPTSTGTITPAPTATNTATPAPGGLATWTPGPWMLTRFAATYDAKFLVVTNTPLPSPTVTSTRAK